MKTDDDRCLSVVPGPIEAAVLSRFTDVAGGDSVGAGEIGDRPLDLEDAGVGAGAEGELV